MATIDSLTKLKERLLHDNARLGRLKIFLDSNKYNQKAKISVCGINEDGTQGYTSEHATLDDLDTSFCQLFLVENVCPETVSSLNEKLGVELDVFARHIENESWFRTNVVSRCVPDLPSVKRGQSYLQLRYVETMPLHDERCSDYRTPRNMTEVYDFVQYSHAEKAEKVIEAVDDLRDHVSGWRLPKEGLTTVPRPAEYFEPKARPRTSDLNGKRFCPILWVRCVITIWFKRTAEGGWIGMYLNTTKLLKY